MSNAFTRIALKEDQIRYKKVGKRYIRVNDPCGYEGLGKGWWLVKVSEHSTSVCACIHPDRAEIAASVKDKEDQLIDIIRAASEARPQQRPITHQANEDWKWFVKRNGEEFSTLEYPSIQENAEKIIAALLK
jgi:hypothetical protein